MTIASALEFQPYPPPAGPLEHARIPWDSDSMGFPCYELRCVRGNGWNLDAQLRAWLAQLATHDRCLVVTRTSPGDVALNRLLTRHGFYPVETLVEFHLTDRQFRPILPEGRLRKTAAPEFCCIRESSRPCARKGSGW